MLEEKEALFLLIVGGVVDAGRGIVCLEEEALFHWDVGGRRCCSVGRL